MADARGGLGRWLRRGGLAFGAAILLWVGLGSPSNSRAPFHAEWVHAAGVTSRALEAGVFDPYVSPKAADVPSALKAATQDAVSAAPIRENPLLKTIARQAIAIGARSLWQQLGVVNEEADSLARSQGLTSVMDRCIKIEYARLFGGLGWAGVNTGVISSRRSGLASGYARGPLH